MDRVPPEIIEAWDAGRRIPGATESWLTLEERVLTPFGLNPVHGLVDQVHAVAAPTLFVWGERDAYAPPTVGEAVAERMPDARVVAVPDAGHLPWLDQPEACAAALTEFLD